MKVKLDLNVQLSTCQIFKIYKIYTDIYIRIYNGPMINPVYRPVSVVFVDRPQHCDVFVFKVCTSNCICVLWPLEGSILH